MCIVQNLWILMSNLLSALSILKWMHCNHFTGGIMMMMIIVLLLWWCYHRRHDYRMLQKATAISNKRKKKFANFMINVSEKMYSFVHLHLYDEKKTSALLHCQLFLHNAHLISKLVRQKSHILLLLYTDKRMNKCIETGENSI